MATCLVALGSNSGDRERAIDVAFAEIDAAAGGVRRRSRMYRSRPVGGPAGQGEFLNAAAVIETTLAPLPLLQTLQEIERRHGRVRSARWGARPLDLDLLVYDDRIIETPELSVPHPRMSFRRFVLEPAAEIAGEFRHPTIGWTVDRLLYHLNTAADRLAILSCVENQRRELATMLADRFGTCVIAPPADESVPPLWPAERSTWMAVELSAPRELTAISDRPISVPPGEYSVAGRPKLSVVLDPASSDELVGEPASQLWHDRGPTLVLRTSDMQEIRQEALAAVQAVWPELCPPRQNA